MKTKLNVLFLFTGLLILSNTYCQNQTSSDTLKLLLNTSKAANKNLFLVFGWEGCSWCRIFDKYHKDSTVHAILGKYFVVSKVDCRKTQTGVDLYKTYGKPGTPSWTIFDLKGTVLVDSDNGKGNIGYPAEPNELEYYVAALQKAVPAISKSECDLLVTKLKEYRAKK